MANVLEEKLREAAHLGDLEGMQAIISQNVDVNSKNALNGWYKTHQHCLNYSNK